MRHAATAFLRTSRRAAAGRGLEPLEDRLFLSAPTLTPGIPVVSTTRVVLPVTYHSDSPIDLSSIGDGDLGATGPAGFAQLATLLEPPTVQANGDVLAKYVLSAPGGQWDWPNANGAYNVGVFADAVRNTAGEGSAQGGAGSYWFWFNTPRYTMSQQIVRGPDDPYRDIPAGDHWFFRFEQSTPLPSYPVSLLLHVTGPNGYDQTASVYQYRGYRESSWVGTQGEITGSVPAPGGTWDFTDGGTYTVQAGLAAYPGARTIGEVVMTRTFTQDLGGPHAEVVGTSFGANDALVTVRYAPAPGVAIAMATLPSSTIKLHGRTGTIAEPAALNADGSVTAIYRVPAPFAAGWNYHLNGPAPILTVAGYYAADTPPHAVADNSGHLVGVGPIGNATLSLDPPSPMALRTLSATIAAWDVELSFRNNLGNVLAGDLRPSGDNLLVYAEIDGVYQRAPVQVEYLSSASSPGDVFSVRYRLRRIGGFFWDGTYTINAVPGSMFAGGLNFTLSQPMVMRFAAPSVLGLQTLSRTSTVWDLQLSFSNPSSAIDTASISGQNLLIGAPGGRTLRITLMSFSTGSDHVLRIRYRVQPTSAGITLARGAYNFSLRAGSVTVGGIALPGQFIAGLTI